MSAAKKENKGGQIEFWFWLLSFIVSNLSIIIIKRDLLVLVERRLYEKKERDFLLVITFNKELREDLVVYVTDFGVCS